MDAPAIYYLELNMLKVARLLPVILFVALAVSVFGGPAQAGGVKEEKLRAHIAVLASDEFEGRKPGTDGETKTIDYIAKVWADAGLKPAASDGSWFQPVPMVERSPGNATVTFSIRGRKLRFADDEIILVGKEASYKRKSVPVFFSGYGVTPDGEPVGDVSGKIVFMLMDAPDFLPDDLKSARLRREKLIDAGAEAVILITDGERKWAAIRRRFGSSGIALQAREKRAPLHGAVSPVYIVGLATQAKQDWDRLSRDAAKVDFAGKDFAAKAELDVNTNVRRFDSTNVIGKIPGKKQGSGAVLYLGHWDHLGICRGEDAEDRICNGAVDNASGIAVLSEVARKLARKRHDRDIYFLATTGEESGLLGAYHFADNPVFPLEDIVVALNVDTIAIAPAGSKVAIVGRGTTQLDGAVEKIARKLGREIEKSEDANAFIRRQDGWALAKKGVPALMIGGSFSDMKLTRKFLRGNYHGPGDELTEETELGGAAEDTNLHIALGKYFASRRKYRRDKNNARDKTGS